MRDILRVRGAAVGAKVKLAPGVIDWAKVAREFPDIEADIALLQKGGL